MAQRLGGEDQRIEIELLEIFARLFLQRRALALVGKDRTAVIHARGVGRQVAAAVRRADFQVRETVERALEDQMRERKRCFQRIADHIAERAAALDPLGDAG